MFDLRIATIEHPKIVNRLSMLIKQAKSITQQPNKSVYRVKSSWSYATLRSY